MAESVNKYRTVYEDPFKFSPRDGEEEDMRSNFIDTIGVLLVLLLGLIGNHVI